MSNRVVFAKKLKNLMLRDGKKQSDLSNDLDISFSTIADWYHGRKFPRSESLEKIAEYFSITVPELLLDPNSIIETDFNSFEVPVFRSINCGDPKEEEDEVIGYEALPASWKKKGEFFGVRAKGNSMFPKIEDGDILIARRQPTATSGDFVIVKINGDEFTCKKYLFRHDGIQLQPLNAQYDTLFFTSKEVAEKPVTIIGKVVEIRKRV